MKHGDRERGLERAGRHLAGKGRGEGAGLGAEGGPGSGWRAVWDELADGLWPATCRVCAEPAGDGLACDEHALGLEARPLVCGLCSRGLPGSVALEPRDPMPPWRSSRVARRSSAWRRCRECREAAPGYGRLVCLGPYQAGLRTWTLALKNGRRSLAEPLARLLAARLVRAGWAAPDAGTRVLLVPVPAHPWRVFERGADGPLWLAGALGRELNWPVARWLIRPRFTPAQGAPGSSSRAGNVRGALAFDKRRVKALGRAASRGAGPLAVVLVDDVVTSGATLAEAARVLRASFASAELPRPWVGAVAVARAEWGPGG